MMVKKAIIKTDMSQVLNNLLKLLKLEKIEQGIYRGPSQDLGFKSLNYSNNLLLFVRMKIFLC